MNILKKSVVIALSSVCCIAFSADRKPEIIRVGGDSYLLVKQIESVKQNDIFQKNVSILRRYDAAIKAAKSRSETASESDKKILSVKIKQLEDEYAANNAVMIKTYNFSGDRKYMFLFGEVYLSTPLSNDEAENLRTKEGVVLDPQKIAQKDSLKLYRQLSIKEHKKIAQFQRLITSFTAKQAELKKLRDLSAKAESPAERESLALKISLSEKYLTQTELQLEKDYGMLPKRNYILEVKSMKIYLQLTMEELVRLSSKK